MKEGFLKSLLWVVLIAIGVLVVVIFTGCTTRGGFPRFLHRGEESDAAIERRMERELADHEAMEQREGRFIPFVDWGTNTPPSTK